jgi:hypothetical protein
MDGALAKVLDHDVDMEDRLAQFQLDAEEEARAAEEEKARVVKAAADAVAEKKSDFHEMMRLVKLGIVMAPKTLKLTWEEEMSEEEEGDWEDGEEEEEIDQLVDGWMIRGHEGHRKDSPKYVGEEARSAFFQMYRKDVHLRNHGLLSPRSKSLLECNRLQLLPRPLGVVRRDIAIIDLHSTGMGNQYCAVFAGTVHHTLCTIHYTHACTARCSQRATSARVASGV